MLAQAQACFYEKALAARNAAEDDGRDAPLAAPVVARLAAHAAHLCFGPFKKAIQTKTSKSTINGLIETHWKTSQRKARNQSIARGR